MEKESAKDTSVSAKEKSTGKKQSSKTPAKVSAKDQGALLCLFSVNLDAEILGLLFNFIYLEMSTFQFGLRSIMLIIKKKSII